MAAYPGIFELISMGVVIDPHGYLFGYLDPGTGSMMLQFLIAGFLSVIVALRAYRHSIVKFIRLRLGFKKTIETNSEKNLADTDEQTVDHVENKAA